MTTATPSKYSMIVVLDPDTLESIILDHYSKGQDFKILFTSSWDTNSTKIVELLMGTRSDWPVVYVVDTFDIPNALPIIRSCLAEVNEDLPKLPHLRNYGKIPSLLSFKKGYPKLVDYGGIIYSELGLN